MIWYYIAYKGPLAPDSVAMARALDGDLATMTAAIAAPIPTCSVRHIQGIDDVSGIAGVANQKRARNSQFQYIYMQPMYVGIY